MANFGTPSVIGTLTSSTSSTSYVVPITATTSLGDCIVVVVSSAGAGVNNTPSSVTDSENTGLQYQQVTTTSGSGQLTHLRLYNSKILTGADTVTVNFPSANTFLKSIAVIDCPGAVADDLLSVTSNSGSSTAPLVNTVLGTSYELVIFAQNNGNTGGAPSGFSPLNNLVTLHSGSAIYTTVSYQIVTSPGSYTATDTISSSGWSAITAGMISSVPVFFNQNPYTLAGYPPPLAYNPSLQWAKPHTPSPAIPTVISSAPVNIQGAQSNTFTGGVNSLKGDATSFNASIGNWTNGGNTTITQTNTVSHNAQGALQATATGSGSLTVLSSTSGKIQQNGLPASNGDTIFAAGWILAATAGRNAQIGFSMLDTNGNVLGSNIFGSTVLDSTGVWTLITATGVVNQANTAYVRSTLQWSSVGASEVHYLSDAWLFDVTSGAGMNEQIQIFTPSMQQFQLQPDGIPYPLSLNGNLQNLPRQVQTAPFAVFQPGASSAVTVSAPAGNPAILQTFSQPRPWQQILPGLRFIPALNWSKQQISTSNPVVYIDGGQASSVIVNAQFPDMSATVSVSASPSAVSVVSPTPATVISGITANINVTGASPSLSVSVTGVTANSNVSAIPGSAAEAIHGVTATATSASSGQVVTVSPAGDVSEILAGTPDGNVVVIETGNPGNTTVASTGTAVSSVAGRVSNVSVAAINGSISETVTGVQSLVTVSSSGTPGISISGTTSNISVVAPPGAVVTGKFVLGVPANVTVSSKPVAEVTVQGVTATVSTSSPAGNTILNIAGTGSNTSVSAPSGFAGPISLTGTIVNPDTQMDILLSRQGKLLEIPVEDMLLSKTSPPVSQGI